MTTLPTRNEISTAHSGMVQANTCPKVIFLNQPWRCAMAILTDSLIPTLVPLLSRFSPYLPLGPLLKGPLQNRVRVTSRAHYLDLAFAPMLPAPLPRQGGLGRGGP